jgi:hypothetical protein
MIDDNVKIILHDTSPGLSIAEQAAPDFAVTKQKMFAFAAPLKWWYALSHFSNYPIFICANYPIPHPLALDDRRLIV